MLGNRETHMAGRKLQRVSSKMKWVPPDGGWGWMVILGACINMMAFPAVSVCLGILFTERLSQLGGSTTHLTIMGNALSSVWSLFALFMAPAAELFGHRRVTILGGLLSMLTLLLCAFATSLTSLILSYSITGGMAGTMSTFMGFILIPRYFDKRKGLANGILTSFASMGKMVMFPFIQYLKDKYGYKWTCLLVGAVTLHTCAGGMLFHPPEWHQKRVPVDDDEDENKAMVVDPARQARAQERRPPSVALDVVLTQDGIVSTCEGSPLPQAVAEAQNDPEDEVIFVLPTPPQPQPQPNSTEDEVVLFSRDAAVGSNSAVVATQKSTETYVPKMTASELSLAGSVPLLWPADNTVYHEDDPKARHTCCGDFLVFKVFRMLDYSLLKNPVFYLMAVPNVIALMVHLNTLYLLPNYALSLDFTPYQSAFALSAFAIVEAVSRLLFATMSDFDWFPRRLFYVAGLGLAALALAGMTCVKSYLWVLGCSIVLSIGLSLTSVLFLQLSIDELGVSKYSQVIGFCSILNGIVFVIGGPFIGFVRDHFDSYMASFWMISVECLLAIIIYGVILCSVRLRQR